MVLIMFAVCVAEGRTPWSEMLVLSTPAEDPPDSERRTLSVARRELEYTVPVCQPLEGSTTNMRHLRLPRAKKKQM